MPGCRRAADSIWLLHQSGGIKDARWARKPEGFALALAVAFMVACTGMDDVGVAVAPLFDAGTDASRQE